MDAIINQVTERKQCAACYTEVTQEDQFCTNCGYPLKGTEEEKKGFRITDIPLTFNRREYDKKLQNAANTLYYLTGVFVLSGVILFFQTKDEPDTLGYVLPNFILAVVFLVLGGYTKKKPLTCIISGFSLYVIIQILNAMSNPQSLISAIYIKIIIIGFLVKGIKSAIEVDRIKKGNNIA